MKKILVTGGTGMLGQALGRVLGERGLCLGRQELNVTDTGRLRRQLDELAPTLQAVINCAAYTDVDGAEYDLGKVDLVNAAALRWLAIYCGEYGIPLLHVSTDYVFDGSDPRGYTEDRVDFNPLNCYGRAKLQGEHLLRAYGGPYWLVRTSGLFGMGGRNFVDAILRQLDRGGELRVVADQFASPTWVDHLAPALVRLIDEPAPYGTYHLAAEGHANWAAVAHEILTAQGLEPGAVVTISSRELNRPARRPLRPWLLNTKRPLLPTWQTGLRAYLETKRAGRNDLPALANSVDGHQTQPV